MIYSDQLIKGEKYKIPNCNNVFTFGGRYGNNFKCFTRQDGMRFMGREFVEFKDGKSFLDLEHLTNAST